MGIEENKAVVKRWFDEGMNGGDVNAVERVWAPSFVVHPKGGEQSTQTHEDKRAYLADGAKAFSDIHVEYGDPIAEGDRVSVRWITSATKRETGEKVSYTHIYQYRIKDGKIVEEWQCF